MKIIYLSDSILPSRAANSIHVMKMCEAFAYLNHEVILVVPKYPRKMLEQEVNDIYDYYGVQRKFKVKYISYPNMRGEIYWRAFKTALWLKKQSADLVYSRDLWSSVFASRLAINLVHEFHGPLKESRSIKGFFLKGFYKSRCLKGAVVISNALKNIFLQQGFPADSIIVAHDAANESHSNALDLGPGFHVGYTGHLYRGRGIELIIHLAAKLPSATFHLIGGKEEDIAYYKTQTTAPNIIFHGFKQPSEIAGYRNAMNVLIAPYQKSVRIWGGDKDTSAYMSPLKIFEYMASAKSIIASDLPVIREVLNERNAVLCDPEDLSAWEQALGSLINNPDEGKLLGKNAHKDFMEAYTWKRRAENILMNVSKL